MFDPFRVGNIFYDVPKVAAKVLTLGYYLCPLQGQADRRGFFCARLGFMMTITKDIPITIDSEILSGAPVFRGTRVPVSALLENLEAGVSLDEFLENFPTVTRDQAVRILEHFRLSLDDLSLAA